MNNEDENKFYNVIFEHKIIRNIYNNIMSATIIDLIEKEGKLFILKKINRKILFSKEQID